MNSLFVRSPEVPHSIDFMEPIKYDYIIIIIIIINIIVNQHFIVLIYGK